MAAWNKYVETNSTSNTTSYTSGSFTPTAGHLMVVCVQASDTLASAPTLSGSANSMTFSRSGTSATKGSNGTCWLFVSKQKVPSSPASMTVTFDCTGDAATSCDIAVFGLSSMTRQDLSAIRQIGAANNVAGGTAPAPALTGAALTTNPCLMMVFCSVAAPIATPNGSWTEQVDASQSNPTTGYYIETRDSGFTGSSLTFSTSTIGNNGAILVEFDAASAVTVGTAEETDSGGTFGRVKTKAVGVATETDTAQPITRQSGHVTTIGVATETDASVAFGRIKTRAVGTASETDTAVAFTRVKSRALGTASETDTAVQFGMKLGINPAVETDTSGAFGKISIKAVGVAAETDTAITINRTKTKPVGVAIETDVAVTLGRLRARPIGAAVETDTAIGFGRISTRPVGTAVETDSGGVITAVRVKPITLAEEFDTAGSLIAVKGTPDFIGIIPV